MKSRILLVCCLLTTVFHSASAATDDSFVARLNALNSRLISLGAEDLAAQFSTASQKKDDVIMLFLAVQIVDSCRLHVETLARIRIAWISVDQKSKAPLKDLFREQCTAIRKDLTLATSALGKIRPLIGNAAFLEDVGRLRLLIHELDEMIGESKVLRLPDRADAKRG